MCVSLSSLVERHFYYDTLYFVVNNSSSSALFLTGLKQKEFSVLVSELAQGKTCSKIL